MTKPGQAPHTLEYTPRELRCVLFAATMASFLSPYIASSINIALPLIGREFGADAVLLGWIPTTYLLTSAVLLIPFGRLADLYGMKKIFTSGIIVYSLAVLLCGFSVSIPMLIGCEVLAGIGGAMIYATAIALLTAVFPGSERGRVLGINVSAVYIGLSAGPFLGGVLAEAFGWRSIFLSIVPVGIAAFLLSFRVKVAEGGKKEKFDFVGTVIYGFMLFSLIYGLSLVPETKAFAFLTAGFVGLLGFVFWEMKAASPVINLRLFRDNHTFAFSNLAALINYSATAAVAFLLSLFLQYNKGLSPLAAGSVLVAQPVVMALFSPFAGKLSDRVEPRIVASAGMGLAALCLFALSFLTEETPLRNITAILMVLGLGFALFSSPNTNAIMSSVERRYYGIASGTMGTMRLIGQMLSMGLSMMIFSIFIGRVVITAEYHSELLTSVHTAFTIFSVLCFIGVFASLGRGKLRH
ncbi:TPA: MFS transporter [Methanosarcinaceae archaeon]|nr:MFS transporter [Methanosarcinaceae archaeon]